MFRSLCIECQKIKKRKNTKGQTSKPILSKQFNQRGQIDLIDMQSLPDGEYRWILVYQDHFTKFVVLRPIKQKSAVCVVEALFNIFTLFSVPAILQSDNGKKKFISKFFN